MMYNDFNMLEMDAKSAGIAEGRRLGKQEGVRLGIIQQKEQDDKIIAQQKAYIMQKDDYIRQKDDYIRILEEKLKIQKV